MFKIEQAFSFAWEQRKLGEVVNVCSGRDYKVYPQENDILMTRIGDVGTTNVVKDNNFKAYYVSLALLKYKKTNPQFLSNAIQSDFVQKGLANRTLKTAIPMKLYKMLSKELLTQLK